MIVAAILVRAGTYCGLCRRTRSGKTPAHGTLYKGADGNRHDAISVQESPVAAGYNLRRQMENRYLSEESLPDSARTASIMKDLKLLRDDIFPDFGIRDEYLAEECPPSEEPEERNDTGEVCAPP